MSQPKPKTTRPNSFDAIDGALKRLREVKRGNEASMYGHIRDILEAMGHSKNLIELDIRNETGGRPDLKISAMDRETKLDGWIVVEAKDEDGVFSEDSDKAGEIISSKWRYVTPDTEWFLAVDPLCIRIRHITDAERPEQEEPDKIISTKAPRQVHDELIKHLGADAIKDRKRLRDFREGKKGSFARIDVSEPNGRGRALFLRSLTDAAQSLTAGVASALNEVDEERRSARGELAAFRTEYPDVRILSNPLRVKGGETVSINKLKEFRTGVRKLAALAGKHPEAFSIENALWPDYFAKFKDKKDSDDDGDAEGDESESAESKADKLLIDETAALLLSKILLLRFFEDYGYFGKRRYLCNGGVNAFQVMRETLEAKYPELVRSAYEAGSRLYPGVFELQPLDWVLTVRGTAFSNHLEVAMMRLAVFDFKTVKEELLSGLYGRFFHADQRKRRGEHYTPPTVASWMVKRAEEFRNLGNPHAIAQVNAPRVLDPACGFGTFLVGAWRSLYGHIFEQGGITAEEAESGLSNICGNDINPFSATLAQMQLLWNIIQTRSRESRPRELPTLNIASGSDSLEPTDEFDALIIRGSGKGEARGTDVTDFSEVTVTPWITIDQERYELVVGNPPWVRPERATAASSKNQDRYFENHGLDVGMNIYGKFLYRALERWATDSGVVAMVIQQTFTDNKKTAKLRAKFSPDSGEFTLLEIVDFEVIKRAMFPDANVRPLILFAKRGRPEPTSSVQVRIVGHKHVNRIDAVDTASFDIAAAPTSTASLSDLFSPDGRLLLRCTGERMPLVRKFRELKTFKDIAFVAYDVRRGTGKAVRHLARPDPEKISEGERVEEVIYIARGCAKKSGTLTTGKYSMIKGENVLPCYLAGHVSTNGSPVKFTDSSFWKHPHALPKKFLALAGTPQRLSGVMTDPTSTCCYDTLTLFGPKNELSEFPFDLLIASTPYQWYHLVALREGVIADYFCHVYPSTVKQLPWHDSLISHKNELLSLRDSYRQTAKGCFDSLNALMERLQGAHSETLSERVRRGAVKVVWNEISDEGFVPVYFGAELADVLSVNDTKTAEELNRIIQVVRGSFKLDQKQILALPLPTGEAGEALHTILFTQNDPQIRRTALADVLNALDTIVANSLGFSDQELRFMQEDLREDPLFGSMKPRHAHQPKTMRGILASLSRSDRYSEVTQ